MNERLISYIEESFLKPLLAIETITDISYNGVSIFYMDNVLGRKKFEEETKPSLWTGTGFALTNNYIVTNYHVIESDMEKIFEKLKILNKDEKNK